MDEEMIVPVIKYYLTDYGTTVFTKVRLMGIAHEKYISRTNNASIPWGTWYDASVIEKAGSFALVMDELVGLPEFFLDKVVEGYPSVDENDNIWFTIVE